jgi:hypothetical protein
MSSPYFLLPVPSLLRSTSTRCHVISLFLPMESKTSSLPPLHLAAIHHHTASPSQAETEVLNLHHRRRLPSQDHLTSTLDCYKKVISILTTLPNTQLCLYFASSLTRAPHRRSSTHRHRSLSLMSHANRSFAQWHTQWWTSQPFSFFEQLIDMWIHVKWYFKIQYRTELSTSSLIK